MKGINVMWRTKTELKDRQHQKRAAEKSPPKDTAQRKKVETKTVFAELIKLFR